VDISISPAGAKTTVNLVNRELVDYERETLQTVVPWPVELNSGQAKNHLST